MKFSVILAMFLLSVNSFAGVCSQAYQAKGEKRNVLQGSLMLVPLTVSTGAVIVTGGGALPIFFATLMPTIGAELMPRTNQFFVIKEALKASSNNNLRDDSFQKIAKLIKMKMLKENGNTITDDEISHLLNAANESEEICPLVRINRHGKERRAVFNKSALVQLIVNSALGVPNSEIIVK